MHGPQVEVGVDASESFLVRSNGPKKGIIETAYRAVARFSVAGEVEVAASQIHLAFQVAHDDQRPLVSG